MTTKALSREIKFRAWLGGSKEPFTPHGMCYDFNAIVFKTIRDVKITPPQIVEFGWDGEDFYRDAILMQFIGLHDKNGKEIYEGDILRIIDTLIPVPNTYIHVVSNKLGWCTDGDGEHRGISKDYTVFGWDLALPYEDNHEIIGNIYENPELINA